MPIHNRQRPPHVLLVAFPIQSHINPALEFAGHLIHSGALVTFVTTVTAAKLMNKSCRATLTGLSFATISDGYDDDLQTSGVNLNSNDYKSSLRRRGSETLSDLITAGPRYTCVAYTLIAMSWVATVARHHNTPSAVLWIQNAALLSIYYHYINGYGDVIDHCDENDPDWTIELPSLPPLHVTDLPSFLAPSNTFRFVCESIKEQFDELKKDDNPIVVVNTFDSLEHEIIESLKHCFKILAIGPLLPISAKTTSLRIDMFNRSEDDYMAWLDTKPDNSVVYVSFGSVLVLSRTQLEELAEALLDTGRPFLWVIRAKGDTEEKDSEEDEKLSRWDELLKKGMVISWCSQLEVLSHRAVGCFVTHCGWNSTMESLAAGVPTVGVPQWTDQLTNAKMLESVWRTGVRVTVKGVVAEDKVVGREEMRRCVEEVMTSEEMRANARRWRERAVEAAKEGGSSEVNLRGFVQEVQRMSPTRFDADEEAVRDHV